MVRKIHLKPRNCECCGSDNFKQVWASENIIRRARYTWTFPSRIGVCRDCGFAYNCPAPAHEDLEEYYADGVTGFKEIGLPYNIDTRVQNLRKYAKPQGTFAEIGGDQPGEFHRRISKLFKAITLVDVSNDASTDLKSINELEIESIDVLAHYDVLEHVSNVKTFLKICAAALKPDGVMICEVPDLRLYPRNLLIQEFTHVNHFTTSTISAIASQVGLTAVEFDHVCSRPYGFHAVFKKNECNTKNSLSPNEYLDALACIEGGVKQAINFEENLKIVRESIKKCGLNGQFITVWAVTDLLRSLLREFPLPPTAVVVDADPRRTNHLMDIGIAVKSPGSVIAHIRRSELLVICAPRYASEISEWVEVNAQRKFAGDSLCVLGVGPNGQTLR